MPEQPKTVVIDPELFNKQIDLLREKVLLENTKYPFTYELATRLEIARRIFNQFVETSKDNPAEGRIEIPD